MKVHSKSTIKYTILVVDDNPDNITIVRLSLRDFYNVKVAKNGYEALSIVQSAFPPDLILLDIMMPGLDGYEVCRQLKMSEKARIIPIVFLTASSSSHDELHGFKVGAIDYIAKPISPSLLLARISSHLANRQMVELLNHNNNVLVSEIERQNISFEKKERILTQFVNAFSSALSRKDTGYAGRINQYMRLLAMKLKDHPRFSVCLNNDEVISLLAQVAPLHDIGYIGVPKEITDPSRCLTPDEMNILIQHPRIGFEIILKADSEIDQDTLFMKLAKEVIYSHHERWDGKGYPDKLLEDNIPIPARMLALAETYDMMANRKDLKLEQKQIMKLIRDETGGKFDPAVVYAFIELESEFKKIAEGIVLL